MDIISTILRTTFSKNGKTLVRVILMECTKVDTTCTDVLWGIASHGLMGIDGTRHGIYKWSCAVIVGVICPGETMIGVIYKVTELPWMMYIGYTR